jgi:hypothetical protein
MRLIHFKAKRRSNPKRRHHARKHRRSSRRHRHNPVNLKQLLSPSVFMSSLGVVGGFIVGNKVSKMSAKFVPASMQRFSGALIFLLGAFAASKAKGDLAKKVASGVAASGVYSLIAANIPTLVSGDTISMNGAVELVGSDSVYAGDTISVSGDMTELVGDSDGDDESRVYG